MHRSLCGRVAIPATRSKLIKRASDAKPIRIADTQLPLAIAESQADRHSLLRDVFADVAPLWLAAARPI